MMNESNQSNAQQKNEQSSYHLPVLLQESIDALNIKPNGIYVDCTFGGGGHSKEILSKLNDEGKLIAFDQDADAQRNIPNDKRILFIPQNFRHIYRFLKLHDLDQVDGILADLGVSSHQFDEASRGFSIRFDAPLDMRMDQRAQTTAANIINNYSAKELQRVFEKYGEVTNSKTLANMIVAKRTSQSLDTVEQFKSGVSELVKGNPNKYFAQVFQALRIEVNEEMKVLEELLDQSTKVLKPGGRLAIITFHSLEDRIVKNFMKTGSVEEQEADVLFGTKSKNPFVLITKKPIEPSKEEQKINSRSRSAKLRVAEKI